MERRPCLRMDEKLMNEESSIPEVVMLPEQYNDLNRRSSYRTPERKLIAALLVDAIDLATDTRPSGRAEWQRRLSIRQREAREWLAESGDRPFGFEWTCQHLNLNPEGLRKRISMVSGHLEMRTRMGVIR
jgi:hypothetical protein